MVNEEMYEEEDDDLPMQYRRLTAHLQTSNADFDRRLAAYLTNHVAMRAALGQAVSDPSAQQQYPNAPQFANQSQQQFQQNPFINTTSMMPPQMHNSLNSHRQSPYPTNPHAFRNMHNRSATLATPNDIHGYSTNFGNNSNPSDDRRKSMPTQGVPPTPSDSTQATPQPRSTPKHSVSPTASRTSSSSNLANLKFEAAQQGQPHGKSQHQRHSPTSMYAQNPMPQVNFPQQQQMQPSTFPTPFTGFGMNNANMGGMNGNFGNFFSTSLPLESQQLLGGAFDPNDPMTAMLMGNGPNFGQQQPFYSYNPNDTSAMKKGFGQPSRSDGMEQTLAPGMLDTNMSSFGFPGAPPTANDGVLSPWSGVSGGFEPQFGDPFQASTFSVSGQTSGQVTPSVEQDWSQLVDGNLWEEPSSQQTTTA